MTSTLPTGTLTFFFTDIEGSTQIAARLGSGFKDILNAHNGIVRSAIADADAVEVKTLGDGFFVVFGSAMEAVGSALSIQENLLDYSWPEQGLVKVRIGMHTGEAELGGDDYVGLSVTRAARIGDAGHGGQTLVSRTTRDLAGANFVYRDLGEHLLKGLEETEAVFQVLVPGRAANFPPLRTATSRPNNLPVLSSSLIGRDDDLDVIRKMLSSHRLVTLLGPGGVGKTRLALDAGRRALSEFNDGVTLVDLSPISDPAFVLASVAREVGAEKGEVESVLGSIGNKDMLLILDNFEQVLDAAPDIAQLLSGGDELKFLVTSQAPLRVTGEQRLAVAPLAGNGTGGLSPGGRLFVERAREVNSAFTADDPDIEQLVELLDGLPLALELAAARANLLSPAEMAERLRGGGRLASKSSDLPDRHRSLDQALAWSYDLLDPPDKAAFRRLGVFAGGMTVAAAEKIIAGEPIDDPLESIGELVDRSLVLAEPDGSGRMHLLDGVRRFALERLDET
ncbi:MAG: adenylate/guanylate cyclase domain-containing protein, partial [Acidimicrobiia bacterium]